MNKYLITLALLLSCNLMLNAQVQIGQTITGQNKNEFYGRSVCISDDGKTMAANLGQDEQTGGQIRVYRYGNGSWNQLGNTIYGNSQDSITQWDPSLAMSASGNRLISYNSEGKDSMGVQRGHVKVYEFSDNDWNQIGQTLYGDIQNLGFGSCADISDDGNRIIIGASRTINDPAFVLAYDYIGNQWQQIGDTIYGQNSNADAFYSISLSADKKTIAIGNPHSFNGITAFGIGDVRVYTLNGNNWTQVGQSFNGAFNNNGLGICVRLSKDGKVLAIADAPGNATPTVLGSVNVYDLVNNTWVQKGNQLMGTIYDDLFGWNMDLTADGNRIAIGASHDNFDAGSVIIYDYNNGTWSQTGTTINGDSVNYQTGGSVSISADGRFLGVGSSWAGIFAPRAGMARVYDLGYPLAVKDNLDNQNNWSVYPNPSSDNFIISIDCKKNDELTINLTDVSGKTIWIINKICNPGINSFKINCEELTKGNYFLQINGNEFKHSKMISLK